ncbi:DUF3039 domain-containing protein [Kribbella sp. NPDC058245]|uniref:DUF3039 domain-containing protein n=1 Tax=Kribbella sp. NPDC058245 TaxID=3346399 RepID=UPI0036F18E5A
MHSRRARPTLRALADDLTSGWTSPLPQRYLRDKRYDELHPLSELPHPIIAKAAGSFGADPEEDTFVGQIVSVTRLRLLEIKSAQWRGAVWEDPESGVCWLVAAGLAKGEHKDHDDFYQHAKRENDSGDVARWLPADEDKRLLRRETAARLMTEWELEVQRQVLEALRCVHDGGTRRIEVRQPRHVERKLAVVDLTVTAVRDEGYEADEILLEIDTVHGSIGTNLEWQLTMRMLIALSPPVQSWDRYKDAYSTIAEPGAWTERTVQLAALVEANELAVSQLGTSSHYVHTRHLAGSTIEGRAVRAMCGVYFVPTQDHESMPKCETCSTRFDELPEQ